jgi:hypothetical protein
VIASPERKYELWHKQEGESVYSWMVWDVDAMEDHWFTEEGAARRFKAAVERTRLSPRRKRRSRNRVAE